MAARQQFEQMRQLAPGSTGPGGPGGFSRGGGPPSESTRNSLFAFIAPLAVRGNFDLAIYLIVIGIIGALIGGTLLGLIGALVAVPVKCTYAADQIRSSHFRPVVDLAHITFMNIGLVAQSWTVPRSLRAAWSRGEMVNLFPDGRYRSKWYVPDPSSNVLCAIGIHGQWIYIDYDAGMVAVKMSSQPVPADEALDNLTYAMFQAIADELR
mgnify:CR=1 FL=1